MDNQSRYQPAPILPQPLNDQPQNYQQPGFQPRRKKSLALPLLIILAVLLVAVVLGVYIWQHQKVTKLESQLNMANNSSALAASKQYLYLYDYGIKLPLSSGIKDLYYVSSRSNSIDGDYLDFSSEALSNSDIQCTAEPAGNNEFLFRPASAANGAGTPVNGSPLGLVAITANPLPKDKVGSLDQDVGALMAHVNGKYIYYKNPQAPCSGNGTTENQTTQQIKLLKNSLKLTQPANS